MRPEHGIVEAEQALAQLDRYDTIIDVRSEGEFSEDHIPGAISCPVLSDDERREVGTMDRQQSSFEARRRGAAMVARNIAGHLEQRFADRPRDWQPLVYCWRGGNRSGSMVYILTRVGWRAAQLHGGYRAYRRAVMAALNTLPARLRFVVICGATGSGKSRLLLQLAAIGAQVLDLENLARHRGSVLGGLPSQPQPGQKLFESLIWDVLRRCSPERPVFVESESRKVGSLHVPDQLLLRMRESECVKLDVPLAARIRLLRDEYGHFEEDPDSLFGQLECLAELHGREKVARWKALATARHWDRMVEQLLTEHYDPAYRRSIARNFKQVGDATTIFIGSNDTAAYADAARALGA